MSQRGKQGTAVKPKDARGTLLRMLSYLSAYKYLLLLVIGLSFVSNILSLLGPSYAGAAINEADAGAGLVNFQRFFYYAKRILAVYIGSSLLTVAINALMLYISKWVGRKMRRTYSRS